jgi:hypothetical protein
MLVIRTSPRLSAALLDPLAYESQPRTDLEGRPRSNRDDQPAAGAPGRQPVLPERVTEGLFVTAVGFFEPETAELPTALVSRLTVVVDILEGAKERRRGTCSEPRRPMPSPGKRPRLWRRSFAPPNGSGDRLLQERRLRPVGPGRCPGDLRVGSPGSGPAYYEPREVSPNVPRKFPATPTYR